jgi:hypothetical protein
MLPEFAIGALLGGAIFLLGRWHGQLGAHKGAREVEQAGYLVWKMVDDLRIRCGLGIVPAEGDRADDLPDRLWVAWREALQRVQALRYLDTNGEDGTAVYRAVNEMGAALGLAPEPGETTWRYHRRQVAHVEALAGAWRLEGNGVRQVARRDGET